VKLLRLGHDSIQAEASQTAFFRSLQGKSDFYVDAAVVAELKTLLVGVALPAEKARLLEYAVQQRAEPPLLDVLRSLPDRPYESLDDVGEALLHVQPPSASS